MRILVCVREPALSKDDVIVSTEDRMLTMKPIQPEQVGNKKHSALVRLAGCRGQRLAYTQGEAEARSCFLTLVKRGSKHCCLKSSSQVKYA